MNNIYVTPENLELIVKELEQYPQLAVDTETTGLRIYQQDRLFSVVVSTGTANYYFNYKDYGDGSPCLPEPSIKLLQSLLEGNRLLFMHNAKFDMSVLAKEGLQVLADVHDTQVVARLIYNDHMSYSLDNCVKRDLGKEKDDKVKKYMDDNDLYRKHCIPGKKTEDKIYYFDEVPFPIISEYACLDAQLTFELGQFQLAKLKELRALDLGDRSIMNVYNNEKLITKVCHRMEQTGILIDREFCEKAIAFESERYTNAEKLFYNETGQELVNSGKALGPIFEKLGFKPGATETGEYEVTDYFLESVEHPVARIVQEYRDAYKRCNTYFRGFLYFADKDGYVHANFRQAGTKTGRFSVSDPAIQTLSKEEDFTGDYPIRRAFRPPPGFVFVMLDYKAMEFRLMVDYAGEKLLARQISQGLDPHQATADLVHTDRKKAKTLNFGLLFGLGKAKLAKALGITENEGKKLKYQYFDSLPYVEALIKRASTTATVRKNIINWFGRLYQFPDPKFAYRAVNSLIQGGCADIVRVAMVRIDEYLRPYKSKMVSQTHDELCFIIAEDELHLVPRIKEIMETVYVPQNGLGMECSVEHSWLSLADTTEGLPNGKTAGDNIQGKSGEGASHSGVLLVHQNPTEEHQGNP
jgi:DNA polymerase I